MPKIANAALKAKAWTFEAKAKAKAWRPVPYLENCIRERATLQWQTNMKSYNGLSNGVIFNDFDDG